MPSKPVSIKERKMANELVRRAAEIRNYLLKGNDVIIKLNNDSILINGIAEHRGEFLYD